MLFSCILLPSGILTISGVNASKYPELNEHLFGYLKGYMIRIPILLQIQVMGPLLVMDNGKKLFALSSVVLCVTDIVGDLLNAFVFHGGAFGMGLATSAAYAAQFLVLLPHFVRRTSFFHYALKERLRLTSLKEIAKHGSAAFVKKLSSALKDILVNYLNILVALSTAAIAARGIQSDLFLYCIPSGLGRSLITMVGVFYSANDMKGLTRLYSYAVRFGFMVTLAASVFTVAAAPLLAKIYSSDPEVLSLAVFSIRWMASGLICDTLLSLVQHYFQGIGSLKKSSLLSISDRFVVPVACAFILGMLFGSRGILASLTVSKLILLLCIYISCCVHCKGIPRTWPDMMFLPRGFGGAEEENIYQEIRTMDEVIAASQMTHDFCVKHDAQEKQAMLLALFVEEMAANVLLHAEKKGIPSVRVDLHLFVSGRKFYFTMMDLSEQFDPMMFFELHRDERPEAHIGIRMVMRMATEVRYFSTFGSNNLVVYLE